MVKRILIFIFFSLSLYAQSNDALVLVYRAKTSSYSEPIQLYLAGKVDVIVDWGDGEIDTIKTSGQYSHTNNQKDTVTITGTLTHFGGDLEGHGTYYHRLEEVLSWGNLGLTDLSCAFKQESSLINLPDSLPKGVTNLNHAFYSATGFNGDISSWDVSNVTDMSGLFYGAIKFNADISNWDVSNVTNMNGMFCQAAEFNSNIGSWDVSKVSNMGYMFKGARAFNSDINQWDVSNVNNMNDMFYDAENFNQDLNSWDMAGIKVMSYMFYGALMFNGEINNWDVSHVINMECMFYNAAKFNKDINSWNVSKVTDMNYMFYGAEEFNGDISGWDVSNVKDMSSMFRGALAFNGDISRWDVSSVTNMYFMFNKASSFNTDISSWNVSGVTSMSHMFERAVNFNSDISNWDVSNVTDMEYMFNIAGSFNSDLSRWNVANVSLMSHMFNEAVSFNSNISEWDVSNVNDFSYMFNDAVAFEQDLSSWDVSSARSMNYMFNGAVKFDCNLGSWRIGGVSSMYNMLEGIRLSTENYSNTLIGWTKFSLKRDVNFNGGKSKYNSEAAKARLKIINTYDWTIKDGEETSFLSFTASREDSSLMQLKWKMFEEENDSGFAIHRMYKNGQETSKWQELGFIISDSSLSYAYTDRTLPIADTLIYRIKRLTKEGIFEFSDTLIVDISSLTGIELEEGVQNEFALSQNYPNPFNPTTRIEYSVVNSSNVTLKVYDILGREVMTLVNKMQSPGSYEVEMDASKLSSGIYFYRLSAGDYTSIKKMVLMK